NATANVARRSTAFLDAVRSRLAGRSAFAISPVRRSATRFAGSRRPGRSVITFPDPPGRRLRRDGRDVTSRRLLESGRAARLCAGTKGPARQAAPDSRQGRPARLGAASLGRSLFRRGGRGVLERRSCQSAGRLALGGRK